MARALVTGGTAGIGLAFARALAARGYDLVLVARDGERLRKIAADLRAYSVAVEVLEADLAVEDDVARVAGRLEDPAAPVDLLVNNAGYGLRTSLLDPDVADHSRALDVMCLAVLVLSGAAGRAMKARGQGQIINVSSLAAFIAQGLYSPIKAWVLSYSEGLANELADTGVTVTALCPGWVRTEFHRRAGISTSGIPDWVWVDANRVAIECLAHSAEGKVISVPTKRWKVGRFLARHAPRSLVRLVSRRLARLRH